MQPEKAEKAVSEDRKQRKWSETLEKDLSTLVVAMKNIIKSAKAVLCTKISG
ncbi:hypothetical protein [Paenibacillus alginolyticus]|uniref:hypothetical protein n=1 Tax=Paenibacillus alginolyticus TaxID=59839 RepID=UPI002DBA8020|nr:hypothetical protein [Paenibacillus alginolyticus]MEC0144593.1 hypothetical protein [Paenibacillus alginolyticus]